MYSDSNYEQETANFQNVFFFFFFFHNFLLQYNFSGSNTGGSFTTAVSNSFLSILAKTP